MKSKCMKLLANTNASGIFSKKENDSRDTKENVKIKSENITSQHTVFSKKDV